MLFETSQYMIVEKIFHLEVAKRLICITECKIHMFIVFFFLTLSTFKTMISYILNLNGIKIVKVFNYIPFKLLHKIQDLFQMLFILLQHTILLFETLMNKKNCSKTKSRKQTLISEIFRLA